MAVRDWHVGKIILLWCLWALLFGAFYVTASRFQKDTVIGVAIFFAFGVAVITWRWLGAREGHRASRD